MAIIISKIQAKAILIENGYKAEDFLGEGSSSYAFKCVRKSKKQIRIRL